MNPNAGLRDEFPMDFYGWNFAEYESGINNGNNDPSWDGANTHGTFAAGVAMGAQTDTIDINNGFSGVAPDA